MISYENLELGTHFGRVYGFSSNIIVVPKIFASFQFSTSATPIYNIFGIFFILSVLFLQILTKNTQKAIMNSNFMLTMGIWTPEWGF